MSVIISRTFWPPECSVAKLCHTVCQTLLVQQPRHKCNVSLEAVMVRPYLCMQLAKRSGLENSPLSYIWISTVATLQFLFKLSLYNKTQRYLSAKTESQSDGDQNHIEKKKTLRHFTQLWIIWQIHVIWSSLIILCSITLHISIYYVLPLYGIQDLEVPSVVLRTQQSNLFHSSDVSPCFPQHCLHPADNILQETISTRNQKY